MGRGKQLATAAVVALVAVFAAGCGSEDGDAGPSMDEVLAAVEGLSGEARLSKLAELAQAEGGQLSLYTSISGSVVDDVVGAFEDAYDLDVALYRATSEIVEQRLLEEQDAGFNGADAVDTAGQSLLVLAERGALADYPFDSTPLLEGTVHDGWAATRLQRFVVGWNTKRVERPASWEALGDPEWKGRIAIETGDWDWYSRLWQYWVDELGVAPEEADARFERIARNAKVIKGHSLGAQLLAAGEVDAQVPAYAHHMDNLAEDGAPVTWTPAVEPVILRQNGVALLAGAQHPATAALFAEWALGPGQEAYASSGYRSSRRDAKVPDGEFRAIDEEKLASERDRWIEGWERLLTLGEPGPEG
jgi:iron(III) transport system substrate-binding protein